MRSDEQVRVETGFRSGEWCCGKIRLYRPATAGTNLLTFKRPRQRAMLRLAHPALALACPGRDFFLAPLPDSPVTVGWPCWQASTSKLEMRAPNLACEGCPNKYLEPEPPTFS